LRDGVDIYFSGVAFYVSSEGDFAYPGKHLVDGDTPPDGTDQHYRCSRHHDTVAMRPRGLRSFAVDRGHPNPFGFGFIYILLSLLCFRSSLTNSLHQSRFTTIEL
jgi:hypothetical protein